MQFNLRVHVYLCVCSKKTWKGIVGKKPTAEEYKKGLTFHDLFMYVFSIPFFIQSCFNRIEYQPHLLCVSNVALHLVLYLSAMLLQISWSRKWLKIFEAEGAM